MQTGTLVHAGGTLVASTFGQSLRAVLLLHRTRLRGSVRLGPRRLQVIIPASPNFYSARTCAQDGFDGWLTMAMEFRYIPRSTGPTAPSTPYASDLLGGGQLTSVSGYPSVFVTPEPVYGKRSWRPLGWSRDRPRRRDRTTARSA